MSIGPHEGRELELMRVGQKPLSMFVDEPGAKLFPETEFDSLVATGALTKRVQQENGGRRVLYALSGEEWRIEAMLLVLSMYPPSWNPDLERVIGALLGYTRRDVEAFIETLPQQAAAACRPATGDW
jgi:hypothetical protein